MKTNICIILCILCLTFLSCGQKKGIDEAQHTDTLSVVGASLTPLASTITYDVVIRNPDPSDTWTTECLQHLDLTGFINYIYDGVYAGKIQPVDYHSGELLTVKNVEAMEKKYPRSQIGKVQFVEEWFYDANVMRIVKRVKSVMLAYELYDLEGKITGYRAGFVANLIP